MKKFTLIELIVVIVTLGILLSVILLNFFDIKKKTITNTMAQNISIMQGMVDAYYITENEYPILNQKKLTLENPQLIDIDTLLESNIQKKDLDLSKIPEQYYWVDVFGKVWGSTTNEVSAINLIETADSKLSLEALIGKNYLGYKVYLVNGYSAKSAETKNLVASTKEVSKTYKVIKEFEFNNLEEKYVEHTYERGINATYLFSFIDEYGLESAPMGKFYGETTFKPLINYEGEYEFEIAGQETMYWIDYTYLHDIPGKSKIEYLFQVKDNDGNYSDVWTKDYHSLDPSKGIKVKVVMTGDSEGNKPSLYDLKIIFKYKDEPKEKLKPNDPVDEDLNTQCPAHSFTNGGFENVNVGDKVKLHYVFKAKNNASLNESNIPKVNAPSYIKFEVISTELYIEENNDYIPFVETFIQEKCMVVAYEIEVTSVGGKNKTETDKETLCSQNPNQNSVISKGNGSYSTKIVYSIYLEKGTFLKTINKPNIPDNAVIKSMYVEVSHKGAPYQKVSSLSEIQDESCVNVVYEIEYINGYPNPPEIVIETCDKECEIERCIGDCLIETCSEDCVQEEVKCVVDCTSNPTPDPNYCSQFPASSECVDYCKINVCEGTKCTEFCNSKPPTPNDTDGELTDPEWITVDRLRFFAYGAQDQLTRWYRSEHSDSIKETVNSDEISLNANENIRIVYRYAKSNGSYWSDEYVDFTKTGNADKVMATAYIQVKATDIDSVDKSEYPNVISMKFYNEQGVVDLDMVKPSLVIMANKDNNGTRNIYSDESNIEWTYDAADPRNKKITAIEWGGDKRDKYPVGTYEVKARVKNEVEIWSNWVTYKLEVKQEKPIAVIKNMNESNTSSVSSTFTWSSFNSNDPDLDGIKNAEWSNAKSKYPKGTHEIKLRVQDMEGYWSDWTSYSLVISEDMYKVYRLEAETVDRQVVQKLTQPIASASLSNGSSHRTHTDESYIEYKFVGSGFDLMLYMSLNSGLSTTTGRKGEYSIDGEPFKQVGTGLTSVRNLEEKEHSLIIKNVRNNDIHLVIDYLDVYSTNDKVETKEVKTRVLNKNVEGTIEETTFSSNLGQSLRFYYESDKDSKEEISIVNSKNQKVRSLSKKDVKGGTYRYYNVVWDGQDENGNTLENGIYYIQIDSVGVVKTKSTFRKAIKLLNENAIYRLEAEGVDSQVLRSGLQLMTFAGLSNGNGYRTHSNESYIQFSFFGTGFDFAAYISANSTFVTNTAKMGQYSIDGGSFVNFKMGLNSIRNLEETNHTVIIRNVVNNDQHLIIDYLDVYASVDKPVVEAISSHVVSKGVEQSYKTNQFASESNQSIKLYYNTDKNASQTITVVNSAGVKVREISSKEVKGGTYRKYNVLWDGRNDLGETAPNGVYSIRIESIGVAKSKAIFDYKVVLSNEKPAYRLESELTSSQVYKKGTSAVKHASLSNGNGYRTHNNTDYITFTFEGTGFDLALYIYASSKPTTSTSKQAMYSIDGGAYNYAKMGTLSIKGLENTTHTVTVKNNPSNDQHLIIDYMDVYK